MTERIRGRKGVALRKRRLARSNGLCEPCKAKGLIALATEVDHTTPLHKGGEDIDENTVNMCGDCHAAKTRQDMGYKPRPQYRADGTPDW